MIVFLPVIRYRIDFTCGFGRPYSAFEHFLLRAVKSGADSIDDLVANFHVHRRVVIEGLVTLMHAGWLALKADTAKTQFVLTAAGVATLKQDKLPERQRTEPKRTYVLMEQVTGQLARASSINFVNKKELKRRGLWSQGLPIRSSGIYKALEPGRVLSLLPLSRDRNEYVRWIDGIEPAGATSYVLVDVNSEVGELTPGGVPKSWMELLTPNLVDEVQHYQMKLQAEGARQDAELREYLENIVPVKEISTQGREDWPINLERNSILVSEDSHMKLLKRKLEKAKSTLVISSPMLSKHRISKVAPYLKKAILRGLHIDILWAAAQEELSNCLAFLRSLQGERELTGGRLMVLDNASQTTLPFLISDENGVFDAYMGSFNWLGGDTDTSMSIRIRERGVLSRICHLAADAIAADQRLYSSGTVIGLRNVASNLDSQEDYTSLERTVGEDQVRLRFLFDQKVDLAIVKTIRNAKQTLTIATPNLSTRRLALYGGEIRRSAERHTKINWLLDSNGYLAYKERPEFLPNVARLQSDLGTSFLLADGKMILMSSHELSQRHENKERLGENMVAVQLIGDTVMSFFSQILQTTMKLPV